MNIAATIVVIIYFIGLLIIGWYTSRLAGKSVEDYWIASGKTPIWINLPAALSVYISGGSFLGIAGIAYSSGAFQASMFILGAIVGIGLSTVLTGAQFRRAEAVTLPDYMGKIFADTRVRYVAALIFGFYAFGYLVPQFKGGAIAFSAILGIPLTIGIVVMGIIVVVYVMLGGFWAVTWTDAIQGVLLLGAMLLLGITVLVHFGGIGSIWDQVREVAPQYTSSSGQLMSGIGLLVTWAFAWAAFPAVVSRVFASQNEIVATRSLTYATVGYSIFHFFTIFVVAPVALLTVPNLDNPDFALIAVMESFFPPIIIGIIAAGMLSALMSSADSLLMASVSTIVHDLFIPLFKKDITDEGEVRLARITIFVVGAFAVILTINTPAIIGEISAIVAGYAASSLFFPMILGTWWRKTTAEGVMAGMIAGAVVYITCFYIIEVAFTQVFFGIIASIVAIVIVSYAFPKKTSDERKQILDRVTATLNKK
ncbi:sodium:solute symporter family protein [Virgibacillus sp. W0430]|uniref:sodium:solute symporter family protein n=1 Tax=Virgibacillus sp. W0430 TaxID=3391580 RepID=UPI003F459DA5